MSDTTQSIQEWAKGVERYLDNLEIEVNQGKSILRDEYRALLEDIRDGIEDRLDAMADDEVDPALDRDSAEVGLPHWLP